MRLDDFENEISAVIFRRGEDYYENGLVEDLEEVAPGRWNAVVEGTTDYETEVCIKNGEIVSWDCDCPYDGYMCKHVVAVLLAVRDEGTGFSDYEEVRTEQEQLSQDDAAVSGDLMARISLLTEKQLREFVGKYAQMDAVFKEELLKHVMSRQLSGTTETYRREVRKYICYADIYGILDKGILLLEAGRIEEAVAIALQTFESFADEYEYDDYADNDNIDSDVCERAGDLIRRIVNDSRTASELKRSIVVELDSLSRKDVYEQFEMFDMDGLVADLSQSVLSKEDILAMIDVHLRTESEYRLADWVQRKVHVLTGMGRTDEAADVVDRYLYLPEIRRDEVDKAVADGNYEKALAMLDEGIDLAEKNGHCGTKNTWMERKREVFEAQGRMDDIVEITRKMFLDSPKMEDYRRLRSLIQADKWPEYLDSLIDRARLVDYSYYTSCSRAEIFREEKEYGRLIALIAKLRPEDRLHALMTYSSVLQAGYSAQLLDMFTPLIKDYAERNVNVKAYPYVVQVLRQMRKINGGAEVVSGLVSLFRSKYARRPRMMQELDRL